jgi:hypothetical protein
MIRKQVFIRNSRQIHELQRVVKNLVEVGGERLDSIHNIHYTVK